MGMSTSIYWGGVHKRAELRLAGGEVVVADVCLLDTGAIDEDYVSTEFIRKNYDVFKKYLVRDRSVVRLADNKTLVELPGYVDVQLVFTDHLGVDHPGGSRLRVLSDGAKDLIVGLKSICSKFFEFFWTFQVEYSLFQAKLIN